MYVYLFIYCIANTQYIKPITLSIITSQNYIQRHQEQIVYMDDVSYIQRNHRLRFLTLSWSDIRYIVHMQPDTYKIHVIELIDLVCVCVSWTGL